jgi:mannonate dehydratase
MKITVGQFQIFDDEMGGFAAQVGADTIQMNTPALPGEKVWALEDMQNLKNHIKSYGLNFKMIENVPLIFYDKVILGLPDRDEQIENYIQTIRNCQKIGVEILGHHFSPTFVWRTNMEGKGRGGSYVTEYDGSKLLPDGNAMKQRMAKNRHKLDYDVFELAEGMTADRLFANYEYFMKAIIPVAEECNVKLALHPDDPPVRSFCNIQRMITSQDDYIRAMEIANSVAWGLNLCLGCCSEMGGAETVNEMIRYFGSRKKIFCIHFRDVQGTLPYFKP